jgi:Big-like domain-containing protein
MLRTSPQQEESIRRRVRALFGVWILLAPVACRDGAAESTYARADTPALLRVIARSRGEYTATAADRQHRAELIRATVRRPRPAAIEPKAAVDSAAGQVAEPAPIVGPMQTIRIVPEIVTLRVGETATLALEALDSAGRRTHVPAARWRPDDTEIVALDRAGAVTATAPGSTTIEAWIGTARARARIDVLPVIRGRLLTMDGEVPTGLQVRFVSGNFADSVVVGSDGRFELRPPATYADTAELSIGAVDSRSRLYHPMVARLTARETGPELRAVVVPTSWTIRSGSYAGTTLYVSAEAALHRWRGAAPFARSAAHEGRRTRRVVGWAPEAFPLPVAFVRERSTSQISPSDSAAFWASVRRLEEQLGMTAFRPADTTALRNAWLGVEVVIDPRIPPAAVTWASWVPSGDLNDARVAVRTAADFRNSALIAHEMLHALGFGHAIEWRSVMTRTPSASVTALTAQDVAYVQLIHRVRAAQAAFAADLGFLEAAEGERRARR